MSIHIGAKKGDIAETVLMPGDPLRAKYVADTFLENSICYNQVRGMLGYTGTYHGKRVSIQGGGMGMPSTGIYVHELISDFGVKKIMRVGTVGSINASHQLGQVLLAMGASSDTGVNRILFRGLHFAPIANFDLLRQAWQKAEELGINVIVGNVFSSDSFYLDIPNRWDVWSDHGVLGVEMETAMLYTMCVRLGAQALSILTVSDNIITGATASADDREKSYMDMMKIALEIA